MKRCGLILVAFLFTFFSVPMQSSYAQELDVVILGQETLGSMRGFALQVIRTTDGTVRASRFVLNPDFDPVFPGVGDVEDGVNEPRILICGQETGGSMRGPAFQLYDRDLTLLRGRFVLNSDFTLLFCDVLDTDGDTVEELVVLGVETGGAARGLAFQVFDQATGDLLFGRFLFNPDFTEFFSFNFNGDDE